MFHLLGATSRLALLAGEGYLLVWSVVHDPGTWPGVAAVAFGHAIGYAFGLLNHTPVPRAEISQVRPEKADPEC
jgi:hypothetical protein